MSGPSVAGERPLRVCIDARIESGLYGGVEQFVVGLAHALSRLEDGDEEYIFLTTRNKDEWLRPFVGDLQIVHDGNRAARLKYGLKRRAGKLLGRELVRPLARTHEPLRGTDATIEGLGVDVIHFPSQMAFITNVPSVYHPHDLQHLHLPELFTQQDLRLRDIWYRSYCEQASLVVMMTSWGKKDLVERLDVPTEKVAVVNWGSVFAAYPEASADDLARTRRDLDVPDAFLLYPAQTWPHKNHKGLLESLARIRERHGAQIPLVCSGLRNDFYPDIEARIRSLGLEDSTRFVGFVTPLQLRCLYAMARGMVFPSRFEGWGMPVCEAFTAGVPVASSSATGLPEVVGEAALVFDPDLPKQIDDRIWRLWTDERLRSDLIERGRRRAEQLSVDVAVRTFRAHYRRVAGRQLSAEDRRLLTATPLA